MKQSRKRNKSASWSVDGVRPAPGAGASRMSWRANAEGPDVNLGKGKFYAAHLS